MDDTEAAIESDMAIVVPAGMRHNIENTGHKALKLYTLYAPPQHVDGTVHRTKAEAAATVEHVAP
jgi:mannose-6-phosphate isomerase-like protein (cupin superfamily)